MTDSQKQTKAQNRKLRNQNKILRDRNKELEKIQKDFDYVKELKWWLRHLGRIVTASQNEFKRAEAIRAKMTPAVEKALVLLKLPVTQDITQAEIKRAYRDEAKATHPDLGGEPELFMMVKEAYELLSGLLDMRNK